MTDATQTPAQNPVLMVLRKQVIETRRAYHQAVPGVTYEDMKAAATRYLEMKACIDRAAGRPAPKRVTSSAVAGLLRAL